MKQYALAYSCSLNLKQNNRYLSGSIKLDERSFTREVDSTNDCCLGKNKKSHK